ncbi:MAG: hypothetical protein H0X37_03335 [Herpetosiphonaceae bacterium]|nr:hypothetical protein [Herpetosiphonaceae bacterium]
MPQIQADFQQLRPLTGWSREFGDPRAMPDVLNKFVSFRSAGQPPTPSDGSRA